METSDSAKTKLERKQQELDELEQQHTPLYQLRFVFQVGGILLMAYVGFAFFSKSLASMGMLGETYPAPIWLVAVAWGLLLGAPGLVQLHSGLGRIEELKQEVRELK
jgi:hypothetical protein